MDKFSESRGCGCGQKKCGDTDRQMPEMAWDWAWGMLDILALGQIGTYEDISAPGQIGT